MSNHLVKTVELRCDDRAENLVLTRYYWDDGDDPNFELCIEDFYCSDPKRILKFLQDGIALVEGAEKI